MEKKQILRSLSERELQIVELFSNGFNAKEVSTILFVSFHTVETHRKRAMQKLGARNMPHAVKVAMENGWLNAGKKRAFAHA